jgi:hypothetical protein
MEILKEYKAIYYQLFRIINCSKLGEVAAFLTTQRLGDYLAIDMGRK